MAGNRTMALNAAISMATPAVATKTEACPHRIQSRPPTAGMDMETAWLIVIPRDVSKAPCQPVGDKVGQELRRDVEAGCDARPDNAEELRQMPLRDTVERLVESAQAARHGQDAELAAYAVLVAQIGEAPRERVRHQQVMRAGRVVKEHWVDRRAVVHKQCDGNRHGRTTRHCGATTVAGPSTTSA
jgi:hypothetical protein